MRFLKKYKIYSTKNCSLRKLPLRINNFKRPKWQIIKKKLVIRVKKHTWKTNNKYQPQLNSKKTSFLNKYRPKFNKKNFRYNKYQSKFLDFDKKQAILKKKDFISWIRLKKFYKQRKGTIKWMKSLYADFKYLDKKETQSKDIFVFYLIKPFFHLNILLWYINFFGTSEQSIQNINHNKILVNNKTIKSNFILKKGDVISLNTNKVIEKKTSFKLIRKKYRPNPTFLTFLEVDHYAKKIVIIKGLDDLSFNDFSLLVNEYVKLNSFNK